MFRNSLITISSICILTLLWGSSAIYYRPFQDFPARLAIESLRITATPQMQSRAASFSRSEQIQELVVLLQSLDAFFADGLNRVQGQGLIVYDDKISPDALAKISSDLNLTDQSALSWMLATRLIRMSNLPEPEAFAKLTEDYLMMAGDIRLRLLDYFEPEKIDSLTSYLKFPDTAVPSKPELAAVPSISSLPRAIEPMAPTPSVESQPKPKKKSRLKKAFGWLPFI